MSSTATVSCKAVRAALAVAMAAQVDLKAIFLAHNIDPKVIEDPDGRVPQDFWFAVWRAVDASGPGAFGIRAAKGLAPGHFDVIDYLMASGSTMGEALEAFTRYFAVLSTGVDHVLVKTPEEVRIERHYRAGVHITIGHPAEFAFACLVIGGQRMTIAEWRPTCVHFSHKKPEDDREAREAFGCPVYYGKDVSALVFDPSILALPTRRAEPGLFRVLSRHADTMLAALPNRSEDLRSQVKEEILGQLRGGNTAVADISKRLGMSDRTLQRRLGELGTTYAKLLDEARAELASRYLEERSLAIAEVALLLGFTDVSAFHRAFRRWTDRTPAEHRRLAQQR